MDTFDVLFGERPTRETWQRLGRRTLGGGVAMTGVVWALVTCATAVGGDLGGVLLLGSGLALLLGLTGYTVTTRAGVVEPVLFVLTAALVLQLSPGLLSWGDGPLSRVVLLSVFWGLGVGCLAWTLGWAARAALALSRGDRVAVSWGARGVIGLVLLCAAVFALVVYALLFMCVVSCGHGNHNPVAGVMFEPVDATAGADDDWAVQVSLISMSNADAVTVTGGQYTAATCDGEVVANGTGCRLTEISSEAVATGLQPNDTVVVVGTLDGRRAVLRTYDISDAAAAKNTTRP